MAGGKSRGDLGHVRPSSLGRGCTDRLDIWGRRRRSHCLRGILDLASDVPEGRRRQVFYSVAPPTLA